MVLDSMERIFHSKVNDIKNNETNKINRFVLKLIKLRPKACE